MEKCDSTSISCSATCKDWISVQEKMCVGEIVTNFNIKYVKISCHPSVNSMVENPSTSSSKTAFDILMQKQMVAPKKKTVSSGITKGITRKDELYNNLIDIFMERKWLFPWDSVESGGSYIVQVLCNALWYITNQHLVIHTASLKFHEKVIPVHLLFEPFQGYNDLKRKKLKSQPLDADRLNSHTEALMSLCLKPIMRSSTEWQDAHDCIQSLAQCLGGYRDYLKDQAEVQAKIRKLDHPVRQVENELSVENRQKSFFPTKDEYKLLEKDISEAGIMEPVFFDERNHTVSAFDNNTQRHRFLQNIKLSFPIDIYRYAPGGSHTTVVCIVHVDDNRNEVDKLTQIGRVTARIKPLLPVYHTREMKKSFKSKLNNISNVAPSVLDFIYKELAIDAAVTSHPHTQQRLRMIFLGETGLLTDLRKLNPGRPTGTYDTFFEKLGEVVESVTAADERRHGIAHLSEWLSLKDLIQKTTDLCSPETEIPSKALVRLQFTPRNPYVHAALSFTSKIAVQYKIQRRQLRVSHPDDHYCMALLKYLKNYAVMISQEEGSMALICSDDKAKVPFGKPDVALSTGVRGKKTLAPVSTTLAAADHVLHKQGSLTPSVNLKVEIPSDPCKSFHRGEVTVIINDSVFQSSSPFRHAASLVKQIHVSQNIPHILLKYSDGGTDHRNNLEAVKCAAIWVFKELDLDIYVAARCAPGHSWCNPAERMMSILNLGLQNCALERQKCPDEIEKLLKDCGSLQNIRKKAIDHPELLEHWSHAVEPLQRCIGDRFKRLSLKDEPVKVMDPVESDDIDNIKKHLKNLFPELDLTKLQKAHTSKVEAYKKWLSTHCR